MRERIMTEALSLMNEQGMNFTVAELACALATSKRTIYQHFESKNHLVSAIVDEILLDLREQIDIIESSRKLQLLDKLQQMMLASPKALGSLSSIIITDIKRYLPDEWGRFEAFFEEKWGRIENIVHLGATQGFIRQVNFEIVKKIYRGSINELGDFRFLNQSNCTFMNTMEKTVEILLYGIVTPGGQKDSATD